MIRAQVRVPSAQSCSDGERERERLVRAAFAEAKLRLRAGRRSSKREGGAVEEKQENFDCHPAAWPQGPVTLATPVSGAAPSRSMTPLILAAHARMMTKKVKTLLSERITL